MPSHKKQKKTQQQPQQQQPHTSSTTTTPAETDVKTSSWTVSLLTVTQPSRWDTLLLLAQHIIPAQTYYSSIIEWVIVDGTRNPEDKLANAHNIQELLPPLVAPLKVVYVPTSLDSHLGAMRNLGNKACSGDVTVCLDDDDYYPPERVEHAVMMLRKNPRILLAGCSAIMVYDYNLQRLYNISSYGAYHSTNCAMAWRKEYLQLHAHDPNLDYAEEPSFTDNFTAPMIQLQPEKTMILNSHGRNTFNKKGILVQSHFAKESKAKLATLPVTHYIPSNLLDAYKRIFLDETCPGAPPSSDISYFCGGLHQAWSPADKRLGGSEQAVVHLAEEWVRLGRSVVVYGEITETLIPPPAHMPAHTQPLIKRGGFFHNGVWYFHWKQFPYERKHNLLILWRLYGLLYSLWFIINVKQVWIDLHDHIHSLTTSHPAVMQYLHQLTHQYPNSVRLLVKSHFHFQICQHYLKCDPSLYLIIPNGIRVSDFSTNVEQVPRNLYRFCYCSCYKRGLIPLLEKVWPVIFQYEPRAELHVYYGMDAIQEPEIRDKLNVLLRQPGVMDHGRQPMSIIAREKWMSSYQLYVTNTTAEIDCISIRESLVAGCIPLLSTFGVFAERDGIHFDLSSSAPLSQQQQQQQQQQLNLSYNTLAARIIQRTFKATPESIEQMRSALQRSPSILTWTEIATQWLSHLPLPPLSLSHSLSPSPSSSIISSNENNRDEHEQETQLKQQVCQLGGLVASDLVEKLDIPCSE